MFASAKQTANRISILKRRPNMLFLLQSVYRPFASSYYVNIVDSVHKRLFPYLYFTYSQIRRISSEIFFLFRYPIYLCNSILRRDREQAYVPLAKLITPCSPLLFQRRLFLLDSKRVYRCDSYQSL